MPLNRFKIAKEAEIKVLQQLASSGYLPKHENNCKIKTRPDFKKALQYKPLVVIAEYKRASPSKGIICESLEIEDVATQYVENGANALSILTEETYFKGNLAYIVRARNALSTLDTLQNTPLLRKDFIFDPLQVYATANTPASALLLIVRLTPSVQELRFLREEAEKFGIDAVVEVFNEEELFMARESGARIIQVNARDLQSFVIDTKACLDLINKHEPKNHELWIAASGIENGIQMKDAQNAGYNAVLIGSALMQNAKPAENLTKLMKEFISK